METSSDASLQLERKNANANCTKKTKLTRGEEIFNGKINRQTENECLKMYEHETLLRQAMKMREKRQTNKKKLSRK